MAPILLAEDDESLRKFLCAALVKAGPAVTAFGDGGEAFECLKGYTFDLILTDIVMPGMDGTALVKRLLARWPGTRVLFMSGYSDLELAESGIIDAGFDFIGKPFTPRTLVTKVRELLAAGVAERS